MSKQEATSKEIRKQLRDLSATEFMASRTKVNLVAVAGVLSITLSGEDSSKMTKQAIYDEIIAGAKFPDQSLRGKSTIDSPVAAVWLKADKMVASQDEGKRATRSQVVDACKADGIAHHTARTQFQSWFVATDRGTRRLDTLSLEELPKALHPVEAAAA